MNTKFELTNITKVVDNHILYKIRALQDFSDVKKGDFGGYVQSEENLSQEGDCWIYDEACVMNKAIISDNTVIKDFAKISNHAIIQDNAVISGYAEIKNHAKVSNHAFITDRVIVGDCAIINDHAKIYDHAIISGCSSVNDYARIYGHAKIGGCASIRKYARVYDSASVQGSVLITDYSNIYGSAYLSGNPEIISNALVHGDARIDTTVIIGKQADIKCQTDYNTIQGLEKDHNFISFYRTIHNEIWVEYGSYNGSLDEFRSYVKKQNLEKLQKHTY